MCASSLLKPLYSQEKLDEDIASGGQCPSSEKISGLQKCPNSQYHCDRARTQNLDGVETLMISAMRLQRVIWSLKIDSSRSMGFAPTAGKRCSERSRINARTMALSIDFLAFRHHEWDHSSFIAPRPLGERLGVRVPQSNRIARLLRVDAHIVVG